MVELSEARTLLSKFARVAPSFGPIGSDLRKGTAVVDLSREAVLSEVGALLIRTLVKNSLDLKMGG